MMFLKKKLHGHLRNLIILFYFLFHSEIIDNNNVVSIENLCSCINVAYENII